MNGLGYACKAIGAPGTEVRGVTLARATPDKLRDTIAANLKALVRLVELNRGLGVRLFRISSDIIPLGSHPAMTIAWQQDFASQLREVGATIRNAGIRVSMHPGQYTVLNSPSDDVVENAVLDLIYHCDFLDALGVGPDAKLVLHVGGVYGDRAAALARFRDRFSSLSEPVRRRLVIENDEHCYAIDDVCNLAGELGVPAILDTLHYQVLPPASGDLDHWLKRAAKTWRRRDGRQKIHYSQQKPGGKPGLHSRTIRVAEFMNFFPTLAGRDVDVMLEVKDKNLSAEKCLHCVYGAPRSVLTEAWARYKYAVLEHGQPDYMAVRRLLKAQRPDPIKFYTIIENALERPPPVGDRGNAADHVWGYFKRVASETERKRFAKLRTEATDERGAATLKRFLFRMTQKYRHPYLLASLYFYLE